MCKCVCVCVCVCVWDGVGDDEYSMVLAVDDEAPDRQVCVCVWKCVCVLFEWMHGHKLID